METESKRTTSRCITETAWGKHTFEIVGYSPKKGIGVGRFVRSGTFAVGGYDWVIRFYPDGAAAAAKSSIYVELVSDNAQVRAFYTFGLLNQATGASFQCGRSSPRLFNSCDASRFAPRTRSFTLTSDDKLKESGYIQDDRLVIECEITVLKEPQASETIVCSESEIQVPPSELSDHFGKLLEEEGRDVAFSVRGEAFAAHKIVLTARSPVFKAELYGEMRERGAHCITIKDIQPVVFRTLLHFIYTDSLPDMSDLEGDEYDEMIQHLLVAADRYAIDRLKLLCQRILGRSLGVENVATTLDLADQHNCSRLKDVCIEFIISSNEIDTMVATEGYANLKRTCPSVIFDVFDKASRFRGSS